MIISSNRLPMLPEFESLVMKANDMLNEDASKRTAYYITRNAQKLEDDVARILSTAAIGTKFEDTIVKVSGQKFPDIVANKYFGVEVKSSKDESWTTLGGSVNESTRVEDVERIFLTFGKLISPVEFRTKPYEDCLSEVTVTHYPRYKINMNLRNEETIFQKMQTTYDELRLSQNPVEKIREYYKSQLKEGESLWWIDTSENLDSISASTSIKVRLWSTLSAQEKHAFVIAGYAFFPSILSSSSTKYDNFTLWLVSRHGIISKSMRDSFSAGGQDTIITPKGSFDKMPQVICKINKYKEEIYSHIINADGSLLLETWKVPVIRANRIQQWIGLVSENYHIENYSVSEILNAIFETKS